MELRLAKQASIPEFDKLPKEALYQKLKDKCDMDRLQRAEARQSKGSSSRSEKKRKIDELERSSSPTECSSPTVTQVPQKKVKLNTLDPIMLVPIGKKKCFKFVRPNGTIVRFNVESLVDYLLSAGDFSDPETRLPFSDADLTEIDAIVSIFPLALSLLHIPDIIF